MQRIARPAGHARSAHTVFSRAALPVGRALAGAANADGRWSAAAADAARATRRS
ncbi:MAG: hypothetical protein ACI9OJ_004780 [Myxococcota bacterium]|jgi:hypothetical protein